MHSKNLLYTYQSGSRKKHFTDFCLSYLNDKILRSFDKCLMTNMIPIDFQKAFDIINHELILQKLYVIGFSKHTTNWFRSYLSNKSFLVNLWNNLSQSASVSCGVPPRYYSEITIVLIYVNDMSQVARCDLCLYVDDSVVFTKIMILTN